MKSKTGSGLGDQFERACALWDHGEHSKALQLFRSGARAGDVSSQLNLGLFYDEGIGVRRSPATALRWYRRAHRGGSSSAAVNIGILLRNKGRVAEALEWFHRAIARGNDDTALQIGETYLDMGDVTRGKRYLMKAAASSNVTDETRRQAQARLREMVARKKSKARFN